MELRDLPPGARGSGRIGRQRSVPAALELIGDRIWWPSTARRGGAVLHEEIDEPEPEEAGVQI